MPKSSVSASGSAAMAADYLEIFGLSADTAQHEYRNKKEFFFNRDREVSFFLNNPNRDGSDYILFTGLSESSFNRDCVEDSFGFESYFPELGILLLKMESHTHAFTHRKLSKIIDEQLSAMHHQIDEDLLPFGSAHVQGEDRKKRADESWVPRRLPKFRSNKWPTLVIELGFSESNRKLIKDIEWWMTESKGDVQVAITVGINQRYKEITIENWRFDNNGRAPTKIYCTVLSQDFAGEQSIRISNDQPLVIEFSNFSYGTLLQKLKEILLSGQID